MAGYLPSSFSACVWTERESSSKNDEERGQSLAILTEQAWSIKYIYYMAFGEIFLAGHSR